MRSPCGARTFAEDAKNAISYFEKALDLKADDAEALELRTGARLSMGQKEEAVIMISRVLEADPDDAEVQ